MCDDAHETKFFPFSQRHERLELCIKFGACVMFDSIVGIVQRDRQTERDRDKDPSMIYY